METIKIRDDFIKLGQALKLAGLVESGVDATRSVAKVHFTAWTFKVGSFQPLKLTQYRKSCLLLRFYKYVYTYLCAISS